MKRTTSRRSFDTKGRATWSRKQPIPGTSTRSLNDGRGIGTVISRTTRIRAETDDTGSRSPFHGGLAMIRRTLGCLVLAVSVTGSVTLQAHHSLAGVYDM